MMRTPTHKRDRRADRQQRERNRHHDRIINGDLAASHEHDATAEADATEGSE